MAPTRNKITASARRLLGRSVADWRRDAEMIGAAEMLKRARLAARAEMSGGAFDAEDRADCAAEILAATLADIATSHDISSAVAVSPDDRRATFSAMCGRARNYRAVLLKRRARELADEVALAAATPITELLSPRAEVGLVALAARVADVFDALPTVEATVATRAAVADACDGRPPESSGAAQHLAAILGTTPTTLRQRITRGRRAILAAHPDARDLLRAVSGTRPIGLTFARAGALPDGVRPATAIHPASIAPDERADTSLVADGAVRTAKLRGGRRKRRTTAIGVAEARTRLARAHARQTRRRERAVSPPRKAPAAQ